jgi:hypothetical protein
LRSLCAASSPGEQEVVVVITVRSRVAMTVGVRRHR